MNEYIAREKVFEHFKHENPEDVKLFICGRDDKGFKLTLTGKEASCVIAENLEFRELEDEIDTLIDNYLNSINIIDFNEVLNNIDFDNETTEEPQRVIERLYKDENHKNMIKKWTKDVQRMVKETIKKDSKNGTEKINMYVEFSHTTAFGMINVKEEKI